MGLFDKFKNSKSFMNSVARNSSVLAELDDGTRRQLQLFLFDMYKDVKTVCDKYGLTLFLIGGSALGAVRHHGFIPWDDDMDLCMTRADYERFKQVFASELGEEYILNAPNYSETPKNRFPRILKKNSYYRGVIDSSDESLHCIFLDLFILENTPDNLLRRKIKGTCCVFLSMMSWEVFIWENRNDEIKKYLMAGGKANYYIRLIIGFLFSFRSSGKWFNTADKANQYRAQSKDCCIATGRKRYFGEIMRREQWLPGCKAEFEGETVTLFSDLDPYLRNLYGDYMQLPPEDKRERHTACEVRFSRDV